MTTRIYNEEELLCISNNLIELSQGCGYNMEELDQISENLSKILSLAPEDSNEMIGYNPSLTFWQKIKLRKYFKKIQ